MALTGSTIASTYLKLLRINTDTMGADATASYIQDSADTDSALSISTTRVGIGTASPDFALDLYGTMDVRAGTDNSDNENIRIGRNDSDLRYHSINSYHAGTDSLNYLRFLIHNSSTTTSQTEVMRLRGDGNVGIGTDTMDALLNVNSGSTNAGIHIESTDIGANLSLADNGGSVVLSGQNGALVVETGGSASTAGSAASEAMRIDSSGNVGIGIDTPGQALVVAKDHADNYISIFKNENDTSPYGINVNYSAAAPDDGTSRFITCTDSVGVKMWVLSSGDLQNDNNSYGAVSDERTKQDIRDANSQWDDIKALKIRNFKKNDDVLQYGDNAWEQIGVVAQEVEEAGMDKLVNNSPPSDFELEHCGFGDYVEAVLYEAGDEELREAVEAQDAIYETVVTTEAQEEIAWDVELPTLENTKDEIKAFMDEYSLEYNSGDTKQDLLDKIPSVKQEAVDEVTEEQLVSEAVEAVEAISIGDVKEEAKWVVKKDDDGKDIQVKSMKYSVLYMKAVKALQEAMERIEGLEAKVEALENA